MNEEDEAAALLAELLAISNKSSGNRFDGVDDEDAGLRGADPEQLDMMAASHCPPTKPIAPKVQPGSSPPAPDRTSSSRPQIDVPPWRRKSNHPDSMPSNTEVDIVISAPSLKGKSSATKENDRSSNNSNDDTEAATRTTSEAPTGGGGNFRLPPSTFQGDRGGDAHDEELLALLRGVSSKSGAVDRFAGGDGEDAHHAADDGPEPQVPAPVSRFQATNPPNSRRGPRDPTEVPPWKRGNAQKMVAQSPKLKEGPLVAAPPERVVSSVSPKTEPHPHFEQRNLPQEGSIGGGGDNFQNSSNFKGDRGGDAHDEELLALLRGVSAKSGASNRFGGGDTDDQATTDIVGVSPEPAAQVRHQETPSAMQTSRDFKNVSGLKTGKAKESQSAVNADIDVVVATNPRPQSQSNFAPPESSELISEAAAMCGGGAFKQESTFQGDRGGDAHDEELLALLKGVSAKSGGSNRFAGIDEAVEAAPVVSQETLIHETRGPAPKSGRDKDELPPWKRGKPQVDRSSDVDPASRSDSIAEVEGRSHFGESPVINGVGNFKQESTFHGERGGDANDEELLALLRGVSAKSGGANRFADGVMDSQPADATPPLASTDSSKKTSPNSTRKSWKFTPPWKKKKHQVQDVKEPNGRAKSVVTRSAMDVATSEVEADRPEEKKTSKGCGGNFKQESIFQGERGGDAHDEELLALLRGVSSKSGGGNRFEENGETKDNSKNTSNPREANSSQSLPSNNISPGLPAGIPAPATSPKPYETNDDENDIVVLKEDLPSAFTDSNWKVRAEAYRVLSEAIAEAAREALPGTLDADSVVPGLDITVPKLLSEKNATALEFAMQSATDYADACKGGSSSERARAIVAALIKGNGFTSPRPSSAQVASSLVLKLMEVGSDVSSVTTVVTLLVDQGLGSKKPKIVQLSASLILEACYSFGAAALPLAAIVSALPNVLTHSNKKIRDCGLEIVAEFCRALQSKEPMVDVIAKMQKSQAKDLDSLLTNQPEPSRTKVGLRCQRASGGSAVASAADALAALQAGGAQLEQEKYANRAAVNLIENVKQTEYASKLGLTKWSEKVGALDILVKCGGEKPYKLSQPTSSSNYSPIVSDMKGLLTHTHFAVVSKAMEVLTMLAQGVGEKLYPILRPLLPKLLQLSKDKKLTMSVCSCLDAFFGNVLTYEHLLESDSALPDATHEGKEKNALARTTAVDFLHRCIVRGSTAGSRANLSRPSSVACATFAAQKLDDSDASVRRAALNVLSSLLKVDDSEIQISVATVVENLKQSNPRAYKSLVADAPSVSEVPKPSLQSKKSSTLKTSLSSKNPSPINAAPIPQRRAVPAPIEASTTINQVRTQSKGGLSISATEADDEEFPSLEDAISRCESLDLPLWSEGEEDEGILAGLKSAKWQFRQGATKALAKFVSARRVLDSCSEIERDSLSILVVVKEHTRGFKETNMNVARSIIELFLAICDYHERAECPLPRWTIVDGASLAVEKISDRKLSALAKALLLSLCVVHPLHVVLATAYKSAGKLKAPSAHEEFLVWMKSFCNEFGAASIGPGMNNTLTFLKDECGSKNVKVKRLALSVFGVMHVQLGASFKAIALSSSKDSSFREDVEKTFTEHPFDPSTPNMEWPKRCICVVSQNGGRDNPGAVLDVNLPRMDLIAELPTDCLSRMGSKEGKTSWKARKAALEDVEKALLANPGVLDTSNMRSLIDLLRAMRERLSDSQSNLKPLAARLIGVILGAVEGEAQGKLGKVVYPPLINAAMNDSRKIMHDASIEALLLATSIPPLLGEGPNQESLEAFVVSLTGELEESEFKASGIAEVLKLTQTFTRLLPNLDKVASQRGETLGGRFSRVLVDALSSSKAEIRSASEALLSDCLKANVFSMHTVKKIAGRLVPAKQRSVGMILAKISSESSSPDDNDEALTVDEPLVAEVPRKFEATSSSLSTDRAGTPTMNYPVSDARVDNNNAVKHARAHHHNDEERIGPVTNPLLHDSGPSGVQKAKAAMRSLTWPEFPEEPSGSSLYIGLKKAWAPIIPLDSLNKLFPDGGIKKQDDAKLGFELLVRALVMERAGEGMAVAEQLAFILRWSIFVLCSKETTVGLTGLLDMLCSLVSYLQELKHEFSDSEAMLFAPYLFEKASIAKGRFKDTYVDLIRALKCNDLLPAKRLGPFVCVALLEGSSQPRARLLACQECSVCVEAIGLSGIGKRGVLAVAKALSDEKLPENRTAFLDLMVLLVSRMNNDMQRLSKICGSSLSPKARSLVEERLTKYDRGISPAKGAPPSTATTSMLGPSPSDGNASRATRMQRSNQSTPVSKIPVSRPRSVYENQSEIPSSFEDELPALDLRAGQHLSPNDYRATPSRLSGLQMPSVPTSLPRLDHSIQYQSQPDRKLPSNFPSRLARLSPVHGSTGIVPHSEMIATNLFPASSEETSDQSAFSFGSSANAGSSANESLGAAASLRARLMKIREKNKGSSGASSTSSVENTTDVSKLQTKVYSVSEKQIDGNSMVTEPNFQPTHPNPLLEEYVQAIRRLLAEKSLPLVDADHDVIACTDVLKNIHAAVCKQANLAVGIDEARVASLRDEIQDRISELVGILTRLIDYGFNCHSTQYSSGISVPLLSVNLASLMAIFRSSDLATLVGGDDLTILIKEAGKALLDPRLAPPSKSDEVVHLDEATSSQLVRAINKLAVQAATGAKRENSILALVSLQEQLSLSTDVCEDPLFNSRLSRVVTKLLSRVLKAEESKTGSFSASNLDMETVICCLEDTLVASDNAEAAGKLEGAAATRNLASLIVSAILKARGEASSLKSEMRNLDIDPATSALGKFVASRSIDLGISSSSPPRQSSGCTNPAQKDVAVLVSALGSAAQGPDRDQAIAALKCHTANYGDEELNNHLEDVSAAFRAFILEQLSEETRQPSPSNSNFISERIKSLRSKLNATEVVVQSAVSQSHLGHQEQKDSEPNVSYPVMASSGTHEDVAAAMVATQKPSVKAFRDRLAAAQEKRDATASASAEVASPVPHTTAGGRAAALRARLQEVKMKQSN